MLVAKVKNFLGTLSAIGIDDTTHLPKFISASNRAAIIAWSVTFPYVFIYLAVGNIPMLLINLLFLFLYPITFYINKLRYYSQAKIYFMILGYSHVSAISVYYGQVTGFELYFYLMPIISVFIFSKDEMKSMFGGMGLFFVFYFLTQYAYTVIEPETMPENIAQLLYYSSVIFVLAFIIAFTYSFRLSSLFFEDELTNQKKFLQVLFDSQEQMIITTDGTTLKSANETFFDFYAVDSVEEFIEVYDASCICETFNTAAPEGYLQVKMGEDDRESWIDYVIARSFGQTHKAMITMGSTDFIFSVTATKLPGEEGLKSAVFTDITEMENAKVEIENIYKHTRESIEYASLIQSALIPDNKVFRNYFQEYFAIWHPKDTVGGDIYLFEELRHKDECLLMVIDCTGHGVPGAFVTMLVKAIERQITAKINNSDEVVSPAKLLGIFNKNMKQLLRQESIDSISNVGFDGGIIYYNKKENVIKFAGAETPLFYLEDGELKTIKGDRYSVGYKKCDVSHQYKEHTIALKEGMQFYLTTDGYLDQNGGEKGFPFGKKRFKKLIGEYQQETMANQKEFFLNELLMYQKNEERNDDVTLVAFKI